LADPYIRRCKAFNACRFQSHFQLASFVGAGWEALFPKPDLAFINVQDFAKVFLRQASQSPGRF
jgi:hypothetical protein